MTGRRRCRQVRERPRWRGMVSWCRCGEGSAQDRDRSVIAIPGDPEEGYSPVAGSIAATMNLGTVVAVRPDEPGWGSRRRPFHDGESRQAWGLVSPRATEHRAVGAFVRSVLGEPTSVESPIRRPTSGCSGARTVNLPSSVSARPASYLRLATSTATASTESDLTGRRRLRHTSGTRSMEEQRIASSPTEPRVISRSQETRVR
jgi:hypothetical protein